eukprot:m.201298 g.201298  ORF g.201298 m.201298 type:complete len:56 (+) comp32796_c4_seq4:114-281(+)
MSRVSAKKKYMKRTTFYHSSTIFTNKQAIEQNNLLPFIGSLSSSSSFPPVFARFV